jgi:hypothetical protein
MKRFLIMFMVLGLVAGSIATAEAGKKKKPVKTTREAQATYSSTIVVAAGNCTQADAINCPRIPSGPGEIYMTAKVTDATGQAVPVAVKADLDGDNATETLYGTFCGETAEPMLIDAGAEITFWIGISPDTAALGCAPGTTGTVDVVFSNMP